MTITRLRLTRFKCFAGSGACIGRLLEVRIDNPVTAFAPLDGDLSQPQGA